MAGKFLTFASALCCLLSYQVTGATIRVPTDWPKIQLAVAAATDGDMILVAPGTYHESVTNLGKSIVLISESGPALTTIDASRSNDVVAISGGLSHTTRVEGFTLTNARNTAVYVVGTSAAIIGNMIVSNSFCYCAIYAQASNLVISNNVIASNNKRAGCQYEGSGISILGGTVQINHNTITNNITDGSGAAIYLAGVNNAVVQDNLIGWNSSWGGGGAVESFNGSRLTLQDNVIVYNSSVQGAGALHVLIPQGCFPPCPVNVLNNTIVGNSGALASGVWCAGWWEGSIYANNLLVALSNQPAFYVDTSTHPGQPPISHSDLFSPLGVAYVGPDPNPVGTNGNISVDPQFRNSPLNDFHLQTGSLAIDTGTNFYAPTRDFDGVLRSVDGDFDGVGIADMGAFEWHLPRPTLLPTLIDNNQHPTITWLTVGGFRYRVQYSDAGPNGDFVDIVRSVIEETDPSPAGVSSLMSFTDSQPATETRSRFYRIKTLAW